MAHNCSSESHANDISAKDFRAEITHCSSHWDNVTCWPITGVGSFAVVPCPKYLPLYPDYTLYPGNATRLCYANGTWQTISDYFACLRPEEPAEGCCNGTHKVQQDQTIRIIYYVGFTLSVVALAIALFLFLFFRMDYVGLAMAVYVIATRNLKQWLNTMTLMLKNVLWLKMGPTLSLLASEESSIVHQWACKLIVALFNYLLLTSFFWMLVEGLYLHTMIVWAFSIDRLRLWHYGILGWGCPIVFVLAWAIVKHEHDNNECWLPVTGAWFDYIIISPILFVLLVNILFLASIVWILVTKLRASNSSQNCLYRKATKATLILFPLLGLTYVLFIYIPPGSPPAFTYLNAVLQSAQGLFVAVFYCFLNAEVQATVRHSFSRWHDERRLTSARATGYSYATSAEAISTTMGGAYPSSAAVPLTKSGSTGSTAAGQRCRLKNFKLSNNTTKTSSNNADDRKGFELAPNDEEDEDVISMTPDQSCPQFNRMTSESSTATLLQPRSDEVTTGHGHSGTHEGCNNGMTKRDVTANQEPPENAALLLHDPEPEGGRRGKNEGVEEFDTVFEDSEGGKRGWGKE